MSLNICCLRKDVTEFQDGGNHEAGVRVGRQWVAEEPVKASAVGRQPGPENASSPTAFIMVRTGTRDIGGKHSSGGAERLEWKNTESWNTGWQMAGLGELSVLGCVPDRLWGGSLVKDLQVV